MKLQNELTIDAPLEEAWPVLLDVPRVANALPGAQVEETGDGTYGGTMKVKIGPVTQTYKGTVALEEVDEDEHVARMRAQAREARGQGTASATITNRLSAVDESRTKLEVETDLNITGRAAQFGRGMIEDVSGRMLGEFAKGLERELSGKSGEAAVSAAGTATASAASAQPGAGEQAGGEAAAAERETGEASGARAEGPARSAATAPPEEAEALDLGGAVFGSVRERGTVAAVGVLIGLILGRLIWRR